MLPDFYAWPALSSQLFGGDYEFIHSIMQQKCGANWSEVKLCSRVQGRYKSVDNSNSSNFRFPNCGSPNGMQRCICLDSSLCTDVSSWSEVFSNSELWAVAEIGRQDGLRIRWRKS